MRGTEDIMWDLVPAQQMKYVYQRLCTIERKVNHLCDLHTMEQAVEGYKEVSLWSRILPGIIIGIVVAVFSLVLASFI